MPGRATRRLWPAAAVLAALAMAPLGAADAAPVYFTPADLEGERTVGSGELVVDGTHPLGDQWANVSIAWTITPVPGQTLLEYTYTFTNFGPPTISHLSIDLSDDAVDPRDRNAVFNIESSHPFDGLEFGENDGILTSVKFDDVDHQDGEVFVLSFLSNRSPVWGDVFIKGGQLELTNAGFGDRVSANVNDYIAVPNSVIPTPTAALGGVALLGLLAARRPRRRP